MRIEGRTSAHCVQVDDNVGRGWLSVLMKACLSKSALISLETCLPSRALQFVSKDLLTAVHRRSGCSAVDGLTII